MKNKLELNPFEERKTLIMKIYSEENYLYYRKCYYVEFFAEDTLF